VYNILHDFSKNKLLKKVTIDPEKVYFDTNTEPHHHFYSDNEKLLVDISKDKVLIERLPKAPKGKSISNVELIIHLEDK
jgi:Fur family iron response transcriptional regulator